MYKNARILPTYKSKVLILSILLRKDYVKKAFFVVFFDIFKDEVSKMPGSKDLLSKMSVNDVIDMAKITRRMLGRD